MGYLVLSGPSYVRKRSIVAILLLDDSLWARGQQGNYQMVEGDGTELPVEMKRRKSKLNICGRERGQGTQVKQYTGKYSDLASHTTGQCPCPQVYSLAKAKVSQRRQTL